MLESTLGYPEPPAESEMLNLAFRMVVDEVHRMFLPWSEPTTLYYYDNKEHDLKSAYQAMKSGNLDLAFKYNIFAQQIKLPSDAKAVIFDLICHETSKRRL